jgi:hypothetical protein
VSHNASENHYHRACGGDARAEKNSLVHFRTTSVELAQQIDALPQRLTEMKLMSLPQSR